MRGGFTKAGERQDFKPVIGNFVFLNSFVLTFDRGQVDSGCLCWYVAILTFLLFWSLDDIDFF